MVERVRYRSPLIEWATEREVIRIKRLNGVQPPWTENPILQRYRFCNVCRRDDRVSQWLLRNVLSKRATFTDPMVFLKLVAICRWVNWPPTLKNMEGLVGDDFIDLPSMGNVLDNLVVVGTKAWTGAYLIRAPSRKHYPDGIPKGKFVAEVVVGAMDGIAEPLQAAIASKSAEATWAVMKSLPNWGSFMAGQFVADLTYTSLLDTAYDLYSWAPMGPGSKRGFNRLLNRPLKARVGPNEWNYWLPVWRKQVAEATGLGDRLNLMDLQNCLCETDKFIRVKNGEGRPRSTYRPETAY